MADQAGKGQAEHYCRNCGSKLRPGIRFCTECGQAAASVGGPAGPGEDTAGGQARLSTSGPDRNGPMSPARRRVRARPLITVAGVVTVVAAAAAVILVTHPFGQRASAGAAPSAPPPVRIAASRAPSPLQGPSASPGPSSLPGSSPSPASPSPGSSAAASTPQQAAVGLAALLGRSSGQRQAVDDAYNDVLKCGPNLAQDPRTFRKAATSHRRLLAELAQLPGRSRLPQPMLGDLASAWRASASADEDFAGWAQDRVTNGCSADNHSDPNFQAATGPDLQATASKTNFVRLWNPLAQSYGLATYQQSGF
jgi:hypothetical protein